MEQNRIPTEEIPSEELNKALEDKDFASLTFFCKNEKKTFKAKDLLDTEPRLASIPFPDGRWAIRCPKCGMEVGIYDPKSPKKFISTVK